MAVHAILKWALYWLQNKCRCYKIFSPPYILTPGWKYRYDIFTPPYDIFTPLPIKAIYDRHIIYNCWCPSVRPSVCLSVCPSVCHTFLTMFPSSYHHEIFRSYYQWQKWRPCKRSRSEVKGQGHRGHDPNFRFRTVTPVWIHIWWWNDTYSLMLLRRGALLFFKVICQISRSHGAKIAEFDPDWAFPDCNSSLNSPMAMKWCTKIEVA